MGVGCCRWRAVVRARRRVLCPAAALTFHEGERSVPRSPDQPQPPEDGAGQRATVGHLSAADRRSTADQSALADQPGRWSREGMRQRLDRLPDWHPSSPNQPERPTGSREDDSADKQRARPESLTDAEHAERVQHIRAELADARERGLDTSEQFFDAADNRWTIERQVIHRDLVDDLYTSAADVPCNRQAIMAGGLGGAGKSTVLDKHAGVDRSQYLTINPDGIKEAMAGRGLIPQLEGLSPMEASDLVHAESSYVAKRLARRAMDDGKNVIWDITMSSAPSTEQRLDNLDRAGYSTTGIFVDIGIGEAVRRADARHRWGHEDYRAGIEFGGRYVPPEVIEAQADPSWGSQNRRTFEQVKPRFADWAVYDNSVTGSDPELIQAGHSRNREEER
jgi:predicted kinase